MYFYDIYFIKLFSRKINFKKKSPPFNITYILDIEKYYYILRYIIKQSPFILVLIYSAV